MVKNAIWNDWGKSYTYNITKTFQIKETSYPVLVNIVFVLTQFVMDDPSQQSDIINSQIPMGGYVVNLIIQIIGQRIFHGTGKKDKMLTIQH